MIFAENAPKYWAKNIPVIPLMERNKRPAINRWQTYSDIMPTEEEQQIFLEHYGRGNIGMPLGPQSGLVALDLDSEDPKVAAALDAVLPKSPWTRIGKKGSVRVFRYNNERTFRIKDADGNMICELLSKGTQIVLPPSIHPDTQLPYTSNVDLVDVISIVPTLPAGIEALIRGVLVDAGINVHVSGAAKVASFIPAGARDNALVSMAGILARGITRGERTLVEALGEIKTWVESFTEKVVGDEISIDKAQHKVVEFLIRDVTGENRRSLPLGWDSGLTDEDKEKLGLSFTSDDERWPSDKIIEYLTGEFERHVTSDNAGWRSAVEVALDKMARNPSISPIDEERTLRFISNQSGNLPLRTLRNQIRDLRKGEIAGENHAELAGAVLKQMSQFGEIRHVGGYFWQWKGANWEVLPESNIQRLIATDYGFYPAAKRASDHSGIVRTMINLSSKPLVQLSIKGVNFANGFLTEDLRLLPHNPDYGMTYCLPYRYLPEVAGHMPLFNQLMHDCWGDDPDFEDKIWALQEFMGATLFGVAPQYQRALCLIGQPSSGKSRFPGLMRGLMPPEVGASVSPQDWHDKFLPAQLFGKLFNFCGELSESKNIQGDIFKQIVEGGEITAQHKNQQPFKFHPQCAHWFASNHAPKTKDTSDGFNRRWLFLQFERRIAKENQIIDIDQVILEHEREAIAAWAVLGMIRLVQNKEYTLPASHLSQVDEVSNANNSARYFLSASPRLRVGRQRHEGMSKTSITATDLHGDYWSFCIGTGAAQRAGLVHFMRMMKELAGSFDFNVKTREGRHGEILTEYEYITRVV